MHALLKSDQVLHPSWRHPAGTPRCFDSSYAARLIEEFNATGELAPLQELLVHCEELLRSQFEYRATTKYVPLAELMGTARVKIWRSLRLFDPARGSAFSFISRIASLRIWSRKRYRFQSLPRQAPIGEELRKLHNSF